VGNLFEFVNDPFGIFVRGRREHGSLFAVRFLGKRFLVATGAEGLRFLPKHERELLTVDGIWTEFVQLFGGNTGLVNAEGDRHAEMRKRLRPTMSRSTFERRLPLVADVLDARLARWEGQTVPIERFTRDLVFHQLAALTDMLGVDPDGYYEDLLYVMHTGLETLVGQRKPRFLLRMPRFRRSLSSVKALARDLYATVSSDSPEEGLFPALRSCVEDGLLAEDDVPLMAITPYFAGIDTVGAVFSFMLAEALRRPELRARLLEEADAASAAEPLGRGWLGQLRLTEAFKLECIRYHPTIIAQMREARVPFEYAGYQVEAGDILLFGIGAQGLSDEYFDRPEIFDPERFLAGASARPEPGALNPFGMGPHSCLGAAMADVQLTATLALLLQRADLQLEHPERPLVTGYQPYPLPKGDRVRVRRATRR
jgi:cytochrome P450